MARHHRAVVRFTDAEGRPVEVPTPLLSPADPAWRTISTARRWLAGVGIEATLDDVLLGGQPLGLPTQRASHRRDRAARAWAESCGLDWRALGDQGIVPFVRSWSRRKVS